MSFSILTPSFGYARFIEDTVQSVLMQEVADVQLVVMDGGSADGTVDVLRRLSARDDRLVWRSEPDEGQSDALNKALALATGEWVGWLNADEFYLQDTLERVAAEIRAHPDVDVIYGDFAEVDAQGALVRLVAQHQFSHTSLRNTCFIPTCTTFIRRSILAEDAWDTQCRSVMDWDLFLRLSARGAYFRHIPETLAGFRVHPEQVTKRPDSRTAEEYRRVRSRHAIPASGAKLRGVVALGRAAHTGRKLVEGGYVRERRAARHRGDTLRWFAGSL